MEMKNTIQFVMKTAIIMLLTLSSAFAHSPVDQSSPKDAAVLNEAPKTIRLSFKQPTRVLKVTLLHPQDAPQQTTKLTIPTRDPVTNIVMDIDPSGAALLPGPYRVEWRALGSDGHVITGTFGFTLKGN